MYHVNKDPRSIKSANMLYDGLAKLIQSKPLHLITVTDLINASNVGRTTFYRQFDQVEDILWLRSDQVFEDMIQYLIAYIQEYGNEPRVMLLKPVLRYFNAHSEIIELLIKVNRLDIAMASLHRAVEPYRTRALTYLGVDEAYVGYNITIRVGIVTNILVQWIGTGKQEPPDELADRLSTMIKYMVTLDQLL